MSKCTICGASLKSDIGTAHAGILLAAALLAVAVCAFAFCKKRNKDFVLVKGMEGTGSFYICTHEVTQEEYQAVMGMNPSFFNGGYFKGEKRPVEQVSWYDAVEYCNKRSRAERLTPCYSGNEASGYSCNFHASGYRLPTEAEWEYAAREGESLSSYEYSGSDDANSVAWYFDNADHSTQEVMMKAPNALGLYDMSGNVWEWCWDEYDSPSNRVNRGGSWSNGANCCAVSYRSGCPQGSRSNEHVGFRIVRSVR